MACGGFTCSKNALIGLNILYILVAFILIAVAAYGQQANYIANIQLVGGIIACGVFLLLISILGLLGAVKHHQVLLFFYMVILFLLFLVQFSIACACLAINEQQQESFARGGWEVVPVSVKQTVQEHYNCCGYDLESRNITDAGDAMYNPPCASITACCATKNESCCRSVDEKDCLCPVCQKELVDVTHAALRGSGGIGLFFSFVEIIGCVVTYRYRGMSHDVIS